MIVAPLFAFIRTGWMNIGAVYLPGNFNRVYDLLILMRLYSNNIGACL